eukprot:4532894-Pyramimonas_sp.AAC.1
MKFAMVERHSFGQHWAPIFYSHVPPSLSVAGASPIAPFPETMFSFSGWLTPVSNMSSATRFSPMFSGTTTNGCHSVDMISKRASCWARGRGEDPAGNAQATNDPQPV